ncbi:WD40/YVTN repeat-like-containing domain and WD40-repeat-containing domain-containing protein [Strongyloides ratti]|uniref:WD40/YVTN repeat-like-containing domain and WD40-repeat-containing domain-containing protein n=1 Tax=Strongyloides ratti TaxID=34506 RepID=A0A090KUE7_STRRB|nr:WD40/YVTN repeat-like-containing domain and WD40-repeat-containing domain-containing protein [Strongyloides ratti]CEF61041.1 WD40/YVTN repeat-like-containing domain and WD40-repeat-containing domain-containing protein [Strongyloides ratti]
MSTITSLAYSHCSPQFFSFSTDNGYVCNIPVIQTQDDVIEFNSKFHKNKNKKNCDFISVNDFISKIILYPFDGTLQCLLLQSDKSNSSQVTIATLDNQFVDTFKLLNYCDKILWNPSEINNEKIACKQLNAIHIYNVEAGAVTQNFISNDILDFQWDNRNQNLIYSCDNFGIISIQDLRLLKDSKFGEKVNKCNCNIYDIRNQKLVTNFELKSYYTPKNCLPIYSKHINCPIFKVKSVSDGYIYVYLYGTDFMVKKFSKVLKCSDNKDKLIQTRHVYNINDFDFHPILPLLTSVRDIIDVSNLYHLENI